MLSTMMMMMMLLRHPPTILMSHTPGCVTLNIVFLLHFQLLFSVSTCTVVIVTTMSPAIFYLCRLCGLIAAGSLFVEIREKIKWKFSSKFKEDLFLNFHAFFFKLKI